MGYLYLILLNLVYGLFFLQINELPFHERSKKENIILAGVWFGKDKPKGNLFMGAFRESFVQLYRGIEIK